LLRGAVESVIVVGSSLNNKAQFSAHGSSRVNITIQFSNVTVEIIVCLFLWL